MKIIMSADGGARKGSFSAQKGRGIMQISIYQINLERDTERIAFEGYDHLGQDKNGQIDAEIYDKVFEGDVACKNLEDVFQMFNLNHPEGYKGRSLSVSDVVEVRDGDNSEFYYCDNIGFQKISFDPEYAGTLKEDKITVVLCEPGQPARVTEIGNELSELQRTVHGMIEAYYPFEEAVCIVCNDEGKYNGSAPNRAIYAPPEEVELSYPEMRARFCEAERAGNHVTGYIVFSQDSFDKPFSEEARTYVISSNNKAFQSGMGGYSIYASALDGSDPMVRLERYMQAEKGGSDGWKIERCYMKEDSHKIMDVIFGTFFICDCSGEHFGSLSKEQQGRYLQQFQNPEMFLRVNGQIRAVPIPEEKPKRTSVLDKLEKAKKAAKQAPPGNPSKHFHRGQDL